VGTEKKRNFVEQEVTEDTELSVESYLSPFSLFPPVQMHFGRIVFLERVNMAEDKTSKLAHDSTASDRDCADGSGEAPTVLHVPGELAQVSDVVLADPMTDVKLADSMSASDVALAEGGTEAAPSFRAPAAPPAAPTDPAKTIELRPADRKGAARDKAPMALLPGARIDDFEVVRLLGRGAFGHVYLARQLSLDRLVALKISANRGSEGRTMARLEHQHIVQVFSETVDPDFDQRLLCMQLIPGIGLDKLIGMVHAKNAASNVQGAASGEQGAGKSDLLPAPSSPPLAPPWTGAELLEFIDYSGSLPTALDPSALHDREALRKMDAVEATAWFGARLAEALDFAHRNGILHRDIKPANILVNPYGRPMLADFNISSQPVGSESSGDEMFGGTFAYMSPEHLDAFNPGDPTGHEAVTARSDMYSLGLVLKQLLAGRIGFPQFDRKAKMADTLRAMADERRQEAPICSPGLPCGRMTLERSIGRCLEPKPEDRFESGAELAAQLDGCRHLREAELKLPRLPAMYAPILRRPFLWLVLLVLIPQVAASIVNITYNATQIGGKLTEAQQQQFMRLVAGYNAIVYPIAIVVFVIVVRRVWRVWNALATAARIPEGDVQTARRRALKLPRFIAGLTVFGWFPGGIIFPLAIALTTPPLDFIVAGHFLVSFWLSGLIALAYSLCGVEFVVLRGLYPGLWRDAQNFTATARHELAPVHKQLTRIEILAVLIPLLAAIVFLMFGGAVSITFRLMVGALIILGIFGFYFTTTIANNLSRVLVALTNTKE
jgi:eukaryotic-like serine/threonine-protein kinase